jgi:hypothetical protein
MLISTQAVYGSSVANAEEEIGTIRDLFFNDQSWAVRYMVVEAGNWLNSRRVLLSPAVVQKTDWPSHRVFVPLTQRQVKEAPPVSTDLPVSRQKEIELAGYYGWGAYWGGGVEPPHQEVEGDPHLRSADEVTGYRIEASDGSIGHVEELILDDQGFESGVWEFRYLVVDTRNWLPGRKVLVAPMWAESIDWERRRIHLGLTREQVKDSPEFDVDAPVNRRYEEVLYDYYGMPKYWLTPSPTS